MSSSAAIAKHAPSTMPPPNQDELLALFEALGTALVLVDGHGLIRLANRRASEILCLSAEELVGTPLGAHLDGVEALTGRPSKSGMSRRSLTLHRHDGTTVELGYTVTRARVPGLEGLYHALAFQDITPLRVLQEERDRLLQLATVGELMPSVLHEAKNPLSAAITALEVLLEETTGALQHDLHAILVEVRRSVLTLDGLGSVGMDPRSGTARAVDHAIRDVVHLLAPRAERQGIRVGVEVGDLPLLPFDASVIRAVVFNVVNNAIQACRADDSIVVTARLVEGRLEIAVQDSGSGMTPEVLARCTELFFSTKRSGSGVGLALCKQVCERVNGDLSVTSTLGVGTTVRMVLPVAPSEPTIPSAANG
ncbi:MAG: PAS domain S-box protein [Sandaracinaceae bacterium]|nr:PAS domain S-box protein [Sandaracinaceae bacterium]